MKSHLQMRLDYQAKMRALRKGARKKNKFNAKRAIGGDGRGRHSELETSVAGLYRQRAAAGELIVLKEQDKLEFYMLGVRVIAYIVDFKLQDCRTGEVFYGEAKGFRDAIWSVKEALWRACGPGRLEMWEGHASAPKLTEIIKPKFDRPSPETGWRI